MIISVYQPFEILPNELVLLIFHHANTASASNDERIQLRNALAFVSSRWRSIAVASPQLWTLIVLRHPIYNSPSVDQHVRLSRLRSHPIPMELELHAFHPRESVSADLFIRTAGHHIRTLRLMTNQHLPSCLLIPFTLPILEELYLEVRRPGTYHINLALRAPQLRIMHTVGCSAGVAPSGKLGSITDIVVEGVVGLPGGLLDEVLASCPTTKRLTLCNIPGVYAEDIEGKKLVELVLERLTPITTFTFLMSLLAFRLERLVLRDITDVESFPGVFVPSMERLIRIELHNVGVAGDSFHLLSVLRAAPNLTHLIISDRRLNFFRSLDDGSDARPVSANLEVLELDGGSEFWPRDEIVGFVRSRLHSLRRVLLPQIFARELEDLVRGTTIVIQPLSRSVYPADETAV